ncbi:high nitrogen upregulated cytochrome P450 monooxygenase 2 [Roridomyces roridus]|uniref:High nitrogen upregulated cytochrome P450 monooxygenase 2 n=1 Tax=Roridomyces roridus TaxID=1738132 RepID=A0AAD7FQ73_9AGAR|nr:high nitrogen upregulated cytochrome P450 monooxygenase 2 [Roridomyces roridus]
MYISFQNAVFSAVFCGLTTHLLFNKFEDRHLTLLSRLLVVLPLIPAALFLSHCTSSFSALCVAYAICYITLLTSIACYRLSPFHPLSKYPGPILARLSKWWSIYQTYTGKTHTTYLELHRKYGRIVRTGPNEVSICDISAIQPVLGADGLPKGPIWEGRRSQNTSYYALIGVRETAEHLQRRKIWNKAFNTSHVKAYEPILRARLDQLVTTLQSKGDSSTPIDLAEWFSFFAYDFMADMSFGGGFELMSEGDVHGAWKILEDGLRVQAFTQHLPWAAPFFYRLPGMAVSAAKLRAFIGRIAKTRVERKAALMGEDLSSHLLGENDSSREAPPFTQYVPDAFLAVVAGSDTTATVLSSIFFYLLSEQTILEGLRNEIDDAFPPNQPRRPMDDISQLATLPLLNAIINETLRLQPPVPTGIQRTPVAGSGGRAIGSIFVPEGTAINIPPYALHRDERYFSPDPDRFLPGRWLVENDNSRVQMQTEPAAFIPFSSGPMNCVGKPVAQMELRVVVATLVQQLEMRLAPMWERDNWERGLEDFFVFKKGKLPVLLRERAF